MNKTAGQSRRKQQKSVDNDLNKILTMIKPNSIFNKEKLSKDEIFPELRMRLNT